jgi:hypothetical protein
VAAGVVAGPVAPLIVPLGGRRRGRLRLAANVAVRLVMVRGPRLLLVLLVLLRV